MKIVNEKPPIWNECNEAFKLPHGVVFPYDHVLYNPDGITVPDDLMVHESVHERQQEEMGGSAIWWAKYLQDKNFLIDQEVQAYGAQYKFICGKVKDKNARYKNLHIIADQLSSPLYGSVIAYTDAIRRIRQEATK
ncbi:MAG: hypothetical protein V4481_05155 [Patescibacteria group bacterium]